MKCDNIRNLTGRSDKQKLRLQEPDATDKEEYYVVGCNHKPSKSLDIDYTITSLAIGMHCRQR